MDNDYKELRNKYDQLQEENQSLRKSNNSSFKKYNEELEKFKKQLYGAIRRIQYLIQEKERLQKELQSQTSYISKLEYKVIRENLNVKGLKKRVKLLQEQPLSMQVTNREVSGFQKNQYSVGDQSEQYQNINQEQVKENNPEELEELDVLIAEQELQNLLDEPNNKLDRKYIQGIIEKQKQSQEFSNKSQEQQQQDQKSEKEQFQQEEEEEVEEEVEEDEENEYEDYQEEFET